MPKLKSGDFVAGDEIVLFHIPFVISHPAITRSKSTVEARLSSVFIVNFEHISLLFLVLLLLTLSRQMPAGFIVTKK